MIRKESASKDRVGYEYIIKGNYGKQIYLELAESYKTRSGKFRKKIDEFEMKRYQDKTIQTERLNLFSNF